jgi:ribosomal protein S18 acetylase RimI-like enzyme
MYHTFLDHFEKCAYNNNMQFELDETLIDSLLFFMEDQSDKFVIDAQETAVISISKIDESKNDDEKRFFDLPEWDSSDGFKLMELFAVSLKNPLIKKALSKALDQGKGVFRAFKNVLNENPEAEQLWYTFKEQEMRKYIVRWYNALREEWGLEKIGEEPEETEELILEDFRIRRPVDEDTQKARKLHQFCCEEAQKVISGDFYQKAFIGWDFPLEISWVAENNSGEFAAYILAKSEGTIIKIIALEVAPEYRGMGIGEALLNHVISQVDKNQISHMLIDVPINSESFSKVLFREKFKPYETKYYLEM